MAKEYIVFLRGINVGGNAMIKMSDLKSALEDVGFENAKTYIQSGNVFITSSDNKSKIEQKVTATIKSKFKLDVSSVAFTKKDWQIVVKSAPKWWGQDQDYKHNLLIMMGEFNMREVVSSIGELKPDIEKVEAGSRVLYQSMSKKLFGRTTSGKLASKPVYKQMTIRNYNTATKILNLFEK